MMVFDGHVTLQSSKKTHYYDTFTIQWMKKNQSAGFYMNADCTYINIVHPNAAEISRITSIGNIMGGYYEERLYGKDTADRAVYIKKLQAHRAQNMTSDSHFTEDTVLTLGFEEMMYNCPDCGRKLQTPRTNTIRGISHPY